MLGLINEKTGEVNRNVLTVHRAENKGKGEDKDGKKKKQGKGVNNSNAGEHGGEQGEGEKQTATQVDEANTNAGSSQAPTAITTPASQLTSLLDGQASGSLLAEPLTADPNSTPQYPPLFNGAQGSDSQPEYLLDHPNPLPDLVHMMFTGAEPDLASFTYEQLSGDIFGVVGQNGNTGENEEDRFGGFRLPPYTNPLDEEDIDAMFGEDGVVVPSEEIKLPSYANPLFGDGTADDGRGVVEEGGDDIGGMESPKGQIIEGGPEEVAGGGEVGGSVDEALPNSGRKRKRCSQVADDQPEEDDCGTGKRARGRKPVVQEMPAWFENDLRYLKGDIADVEWAECLAAFEEWEKRAQSIGLKTVSPDGSSTQQ